MIATAAAWLIARGVSARLARPLVIAAGALLVAAALLGLARCAIGAHDRRVVADHELRQSLAEAIAVAGARAAADAANASAELLARRRDERLKERIDNAVKDHPDAVRRPAGPAVGGVLDELRGR